MYFPSSTSPTNQVTTDKQERSIYGAMPQSAASQESPCDSSDTRQDPQGQRATNSESSRSNSSNSLEEICPNTDRRKSTMSKKKADAWSMTMQARSKKRKSTKDQALIDKFNRLAGPVTIKRAGKSWK